jgi:predicted translin family RNA/ssDNA-binding protein
MNPPPIFSKIKSQHRAHEQVRREVIAFSNEALSKSKRAIFAMHRDDYVSATELLKQASDLFAKAETRFKKSKSLQYEGVYRAALEEYAEALLFKQYLKTKKIGAIESRAMEPLVYLAGLADTTGEIVRYTLRQVTHGKTDQLVHARDTVELVIEFMLDLDATGYLRTKFDQAKGNLKRLEDMLYDLSLRQSVDLPPRRN